MKCQNIKNILTTILTFISTVMVIASPVFAQANFNITPVVIIDIMGIIIGIISVAVIYSITKKLGGVVGKTFNLMIYGIFAMILAVVYTLVFARFKLFPIPGGIDVHHFLMFIGLVLFVIASYNLAKVGKF